MVEIAKQKVLSVLSPNDPVPLSPLQTRELVDAAVGLIQVRHFEKDALASHSTLFNRALYLQHVYCSITYPSETMHIRTLLFYYMFFRGYFAMDEQDAS